VDMVQARITSTTEIILGICVGMRGLEIAPVKVCIFQKFSSVKA